MKQLRNTVWAFSCASLILKCFWLKLQRSFDGIYLCFLRNFIGNTKKDSDVFYGKQWSILKKFLFLIFRGRRYISRLSTLQEGHPRFFEINDVLKTSPTWTNLNEYYSTCHGEFFCCLARELLGRLFGVGIFRGENQLWAAGGFANSQFIGFHLLPLKKHLVVGGERLRQLGIRWKYRKLGIFLTCHCHYIRRLELQN